MLDDIKDYLSYISLMKKLAPNTILSYQKDLENYLDYLNQKGIKNFKEVDVKDLNEYFKYLSQKGLSSRSIGRHITAIREFHKYLLKEKKIKKNVLEDVSNVKQSKYLPTVLKSNEIEKILDVSLDNAFKYRDKAMLELMYGSGLRVSELVNLTIYSIDLEQDIILIEGKGNKERIVPLSPYAKDALNSYLLVRNSLVKPKYKVDKLFLNNHGKGISRQGFNFILKNILEEKKIKTHATPHTLRHTFATDLLNNGADLKSIQELLGHSDISTTSIYTHVVNNKLKEDYIKYNARKEE